MLNKKQSGTQQYKELQEDQKFWHPCNRTTATSFSFLFFFTPLLSDCVDHVEPKYALHHVSFFFIGR